MRKGKVEFTPEQVILRGLEQGMTKKGAANLAGLTDVTYYEWVREDPDFARACEQARAKFMQSAVQTIRTHPGTLHKLAMQLNRSDPELQPLVEKVETAASMTITVVRDGTAKNNPPAAPPP